MLKEANFYPKLFGQVEEIEDEKVQEFEESLNNYLKPYLENALETGWLIGRLNSGIENRNNFFAWAIFLIQKVGTDSVIYADSGDIKILVEFPGNSIFEIVQNF